jgi:hypothetical protein
MKYVCVGSIEDKYLADLTQGGQASLFALIVKRFGSAGKHGQRLARCNEDRRKAEL